MKTHEVGGTLLDIWCDFRHIILSALTTGFACACGYELPDNIVHSRLFYRAKARVGLDSYSLQKTYASGLALMQRS